MEVDPKMGKAKASKPRQSVARKGNTSKVDGTPSQSTTTSTPSSRSGLRTRYENGKAVTRKDLEEQEKKKKLEQKRKLQDLFDAEQADAEQAKPPKNRNKKPRIRKGGVLVSGSLQSVAPSKANKGDSENDSESDGDTD